MKVDKDEVLWIGILIAIIPFLIVYGILKGIYNCMPHKILETKKMNEEIKELETKLGKSSEGRNKHNTFDEYHFDSHGGNSRKKYLEVLRQKVRENFKAPDIIVAAENAFGSICCPMFNEEDEFEVLLLADCETYKGTGKVINAKEYLDNRRRFLMTTCDFHCFFCTLQECPDYSKYNVIKTGLKVKFKDIQDSE